ncbi:ABC transporter transmembrane domain-containing protein [Rubrimonas cliftonensis]|uniref:ABC transporter transmembrane domain-containing protein n=1 Tax=Rubrimonas cliftonensis TaxID=89524 RepID=UPI001587DC17|nr:ABC transporter transmembrane domain-containing protein [Rubrimonas cliftonensis]
MLGALTANLLALALPLVTLQVFDRVLGASGVSTLQMLALGLAAALALELVCRMALATLLGEHGERFERQASDAVVRHLFEAEGGGAAREETGVHLERLDAVARLRELRYGEPALALLDTPFLMLFFGFLVLLSPIVALVAAVMGCIGLACSRWRRIGLDGVQREADARLARRFSFIVETLRNIVSIKALGAEAAMTRRYERLLQSNAAAASESTSRAQLAQGAAAAVAHATPVAVAAGGAFEVLRGDLTVGGLAAAIILSGRIMQPLMKLDGALSAAAGARRREADLARLAAGVAPRPRRRQPEPLRAVRLENVTVRNAGGATVFEGLELTVRAGECVVIGGRSGSGRSLLLNLLMGWATPSAGRLLFNDVPISEWDVEALGARMAHLPARPQLIAGTVMENMTRFQPERHAHEAMALARELGLDRYFARHPVGLSLQCDGGSSHGLPRSVEQRVPLVGALAGTPELILFDETNGMLDHEGDQRLLACLSRRKGRVAMVLVTDSPAYVALADRRLTIMDGRLVEWAPAAPAGHPAGERAGMAQ